jgi:hypothetical protein
VAAPAPGSTPSPVPKVSNQPTSSRPAGASRSSSNRCVRQVHCVLSKRSVRIVARPRGDSSGFGTRPVLQDVPKSWLEPRGRLCSPPGRCRFITIQIFASSRNYYARTHPNLSVMAKSPKVGPTYPSRLGGQLILTSLMAAF